MKKILFLALLLGVFSCRDNGPEPEPTPPASNAFVGAYTAQIENSPRTSYFRWVVVPLESNKLGIGMFIEDRIRFGGSEAPIREVFLMNDVTVLSDSTFEINERVTSGSQPVTIQGTGRVTWDINREIVETIRITMSYLGDDQSEVRPSETYTFQKLQDQAALNPDGSFDFAGEYTTLTIDNLKSSNHTWRIAKEADNTLSIDYGIDESVGGISESQSDFALREIAMNGQNSFLINQEVVETNRNDTYQVQAYGTKIIWPEEPRNRIALVILLTNTTKNIRRMEYMDLKKE